MYDGPSPSASDYLFSSILPLRSSAKAATSPLGEAFLFPFVHNEKGLLRIIFVQQSLIGDIWASLIPNT